MARDMRRYLRRRWRGTRIVLVVTVFMCSYLGLFAALGLSGDNRAPSRTNCAPDIHSGQRQLLGSEDAHGGAGGEEEEEEVKKKNKTSSSLYPPELLSDEQLRHGGVILHILGVIYMFVALAIVCDEFFVPSLEVITERLAISEDVAGATFMAAGGSAPELFTSVIGVFIAHSDVGIGTIVGSAVFNILFVIGACALVSHGVLQLTWWPLFRDVSFYSVSLICLIFFFTDRQIEWWEAVVLLCCYASYVLFMKFNLNAERWFKSKVLRSRVAVPATNGHGVAIAAAAAASVPGDMSQGHMQMSVVRGAGPRPRCSLSTLKAGGNKFHQGLLQLMIHTIDPLGEAKVHEKAVELQAIASLKVVLNTDNHNSTAVDDQNGIVVPAVTVSPAPVANGACVRGVSNGDAIASSPAPSNGLRTPTTLNDVKEEGETTTSDASLGATLAPKTCRRGGSISEIRHEDAPEALDMSWPETWRKRITYVLLMPIVLPLWATLPDVRKLDRRKLFPWTFLGSIFWIAGYSYLMNWLAATTGRIVGIKDSIMGLTFLAAGTSIPDLITSVIVAKKGFGDMAVSSSVGSNIFDVTVGLPMPWLLYALIYGESYTVDSSGLFCSIILLFGMMLIVIVLIASFKWRMHKPMGIAMFVAYLSFLAISLLLQTEVIICPNVTL